MQRKSRFWPSGQEPLLALGVVALPKLRKCHEHETDLDVIAVRQARKP